MRAERSAVAWGLAALSGGLTVCAVALEVRDGLSWHGLLEVQPGLQALMAVTFPVLGALVLTSAPNNRLAWVFTAIGLSRGVGLFARAWAVHGYQFQPDWPLSHAMAFLSVGMLFIAPVLVPLSLLWFPGGSLPEQGKRWRMAYVCVLISTAGLLVLLCSAWSLTGTSLLDNSPATGLVALSMAVLLMGTVVGVGAGLVSVLIRLRGENRVVRQQVKWYLFGAIAAIVLNGLGDVLPALGPVNLIGTLAYEIAILVAVRRYALWEIDGILNRTVVYGLLTMTVAGLYGGTALGLGLVLGELRVGNSASVAAATLVSAVVAAPLRRQFQSRVDRRFDRRTYAAVRRVAAYSDAISVAAPRPGELEQLLQSVLADPNLQLLFRRQDGVLIDASGGLVPDPKGGTTAFREAGGEVAVMSHRSFAPHELALLTSVQRAAAGAVAVARLQAELRVQVTMVEESRRRIVEAADAERRSVERDLHDGAQQRLVALAMTLRSEQRRHAPEIGPAAERIIDFGVAEIRGSVEDLRALAAGLMPGSLVSEGLAAALRELADRQPDPVRSVHHLDHRHAPDIEAAAWFVAAEGLANSLKHAPGATVSINAECDGHRLQISVRDDGPGGAHRGSGLTGLEDRVRACAGTLLLNSKPGLGTQLAVGLPCG